MFGEDGVDGDLKIGCKVGVMAGWAVDVEDGV